VVAALLEAGAELVAASKLRFGAQTCKTVEPKVSLFTDITYVTDELAL
jgi:hypothetical protein